jgi:hypothetical protein
MKMLFQFPFRGLGAKLSIQMLGFNKLQNNTGQKILPFFLSDGRVDKTQLTWPISSCSNLVISRRSSILIKSPGMTSIKNTGPGKNYARYLIRAGYP